MDDKMKGKYLASQPLKKVIPQLLLSVSIFSFVFSYSALSSSSSSSSSSLVYSPNYKFHYYHNSSASSFPSFLSHIALNKNYLFLICNGLLVFLAKTSGLVSPPPEASYDLIDDILQKRIGDSLQKTPLVIQQVLPPQESSTADQPKEEKKLADNERSEEVSIMIAESDEEGGEKDESDHQDRDDDRAIRTCWLFDDDGEQLYGEVEEEKEEEKEELSTQELNQKFEDFIRRMKEQITINEDRQKVVMLK